MLLNLWAFAVGQRLIGQNLYASEVYRTSAATLLCMVEGGKSDKISADKELKARK